MGLDPLETFAGLAHVEMPDGESPVLDVYWSSDGKRDDAEIARYEGRHVVVVGHFFLSTLPPPDAHPFAAHYNPPYISVESIRLAEPHEIPSLGPVAPSRWPSAFDG